MEKEVAREVLGLLSACNQNLDEASRVLKSGCKTEEFTYHRTEFARIMGYLLLNLMWPIFDQHPDLVPKGLEESFEDWREENGELPGSAPFGRRRADD